jgi:protein-disulfide isomerase
MNKGTAIVGFFLCFLAGMGLMWGIEHKRDVDIEAESTTTGSIEHANVPIPVTSQDPVWGNADALVTVVEFMDFQCPFCGRVQPTLDKIKQTYGASKVRIVWKNQPLPFHKDARPAHEAAMAVFAAAGSEAFWKFHDLVFQNSKELTEDNFKKWAVAAGVDAAKFEAELKNGKQKAKIEADQALARKVGASGTPAFRINGLTLAGAQPFEKFQQAIDDELAEAKKLLGTGTPRAEIYPKRYEANAKGSPTQDDDKKREPPPEDTDIWKVPLENDDPFKGAKDALVTIMEFSEFQCPYCKRVEPTITQIMKEYAGKVRVVWKDNVLPFHKRARPAAILARVAYKAKGDKGFWEAHEALFESAPKLEDEDLEAIAVKLGLNWAQVKKAIEDDKYGDKLDATGALAAGVNARGTPHFFVNGFRVKGAQPFEKFKEVMDEQLKKAEALVAKGTPAASVYDEIMKEAKEPPPPPTKDVPAPTADNPAKGGANAKVVIQVFSDFQCPYSARVEPTIDELMKAYGNKIRVVWRNLPLAFHQDAPLAAEAGLEAFEQKGADGFWKFHDKAFAAQGTPDGIKRPGLEKIAQEIGLDMAKFKRALDSNKHKAKVDADAEVAKQAGITGTPGIMIGKYFLSGAQPLPAFKSLVDRALQEAG